MTTPEKVLSYWLDEVGQSGWYKQDDDVDAEITARFSDAFDGLMQGRYGLWLTHATGALAYIILADQFPRNMFRSVPKAFEADDIARAAAKQAIHAGWDMRIDRPARQFFYLPLMHSENLCDQDRGVRLIKERLVAPGLEDHLVHARAHREIIRRFGRFPYRNAALGRPLTVAEKAFMEHEGYGAVLRSLQAAKAA